MGGMIEGIIFLIAGAGLCVYSFGLHSRGSVALSPALFPVIVSFLIAALGGCMIYQQLRKERRVAAPVSSGSSAAPSSNLKNMWLVFFLSLAYVFLLPHLSFIWASLLYLAVFFFLTGERRIPVLAALTVGTVAAVYLVFQRVLNVMLP